MPSRFTPGRPSADNGLVTSRSVAVLGSTGSIGTQALDVIARNPTASPSPPSRRARTSTCSPGRRWSTTCPSWPRPGARSRTCARRGRRRGRSRPPGPAPGVVGDDAATVAAGCGADVVLNGITGSIGLRPTLAALASGSVWPSPTRSRSSSAGPSSRPPPGPTRSCRSTPSTAPSRRACGAGGRPRCGGSSSPRAGSVPGPEPRGLTDVTPEQALAHRTSRWAGSSRRTRPRSSSRARGHRGAPALRPAVRPDRRRRAPAAADPLDGRVPRRVDDRAARPAADARADRPRPVLARAPRGRRRAVRLDPRPVLGLPPARRRRLPRGAARAPRRRGRRHVPPSTTPRTRCASTPSTTARSASPTSSTPSSASWRRTGSDLDASSVEGVLAADRWARRRAAETLGVPVDAETTGEAR